MGLARDIAGTGDAAVSVISKIFILVNPTFG